MHKILWNLEYLCIEAISFNIQNFSKIPEEDWMLRNSPNLGHRLIEACISNSADKLNEDAYKFIFNNFTVKKFKINEKSVQNVKNYDFLNGIFIDEIIIILSKEINIENLKNNFMMKTNKLTIGTRFIPQYFLQSSAFLSNLHINKSINFLNLMNEFMKQKEIEELLLVILENTSMDIENIYIPMEEPSYNFIKNFLRILKNRKKIKKLTIDFNPDLPKALRIFFSENILLSDNYSDSSYLEELIEIENFKEYIKSFESFERLKIESACKDHQDENEEIFSFLYSMNFNELKKIKIFNFDLDFHAKDLHKLLQNCSNLEILSLFEIKMDNFNIFDAVLPCFKTLKVLKLKSIQIVNKRQIDSLENLLVHANLCEIVFDGLVFEKKNSLDIIKCLEKSKNTLTSIKIDECYFSDEALEYFAKVLQKFQRLKNFCFKELILNNNILIETFKSLQSSSETLEEIAIISAKILEDCSELFNLFKKCDKLKDIQLKVKINNNKISELLFILKKFQNIIETLDIDIFHTDYGCDSLYDFLSGCNQLKYVYGWLIWHGKLKKHLLNSRYSLKVVCDNSEYDYKCFPELS